MRKEDYVTINPDGVSVFGSITVKTVVDLNHSPVVLTGQESLNRRGRLPVLTDPGMPCPRCKGQHWDMYRATAECGHCGEVMLIESGQGTQSEEPTFVNVTREDRALAAALASPRTAEPERSLLAALASRRKGAWTLRRGKDSDGRGYGSVWNLEQEAA